MMEYGYYWVSIDGNEAEIAKLYKDLEADTLLRCGDDDYYYKKSNGEWMSYEPVKVEFLSGLITQKND
jgi:hypothetical protein